jgi:hypothetical protein
MERKTDSPSSGSNFVAELNEEGNELPMRCVELILRLDETMRGEDDHRSG